jgi:hypothetical protein
MPAPVRFGCLGLSPFGPPAATVGRGFRFVRRYEVAARKSVDDYLASARPYLSYDAHVFPHETA